MRKRLETFLPESHELGLADRVSGDTKHLTLNYPVNVTTAAFVRGQRCIVVAEQRRAIR